MSWRLFTSPWRVLPDYIIIGPSQSGTTSLYMYMGKHPEIKLGTTKGINYFNKSSKGVNWYKSNFPTTLTKYYTEHFRGKKLVTGEGTAAYLSSPGTAETISKLVPAVKLITMLRNPIDRTYANYNKNRRDGKESRTFEEVIKEEEKWLNTEFFDQIKENKKESQLTEFPDVTHNPCLGRSLYYYQLRKWLKVFTRDQILIIKSEGFFKDPNKTLEDVFRFLGLAPIKLKDFKNYNPGRYEKMKDSTREYLRQYFKPHNEKLYQLLGEDFNWD